MLPRRETPSTGGALKISKIETRSCAAGWRNYHFVKLTVNDGTIGWSEYDEGMMTAGVTRVIEQLAPLALGESVLANDRITTRLADAARLALPGIVACGIGAIENAVLDAKGKILGVPCYELFGGAVRDRVPVYWSHCGTYRLGRSSHYGPPIESLDDIRRLGEEVREQGYLALKTNVILTGDGRPRGWSPGFGRPFEPARNVEKSVIDSLKAQLRAFREGAGEDMGILLDLNFNAKTSGYLSILRAIEEFDLFWVEIDMRNPDALAYVRSRAPCPLASCETLTGLPAFLPFLQAEAVDVAIIDAVWNGMWQGMKIAALADAFAVNVAPHNYYGHLATMMNAHLCAAIPNFRIMETDIDRVPWDNEIVTHPPVIEDGAIVLDNSPGWGTEPIEEALALYPPD